MKVFITGGLGFLGKHVTDILLRQGHEVTATGSRKSPKTPGHENFRYIAADTTREGGWQKEATLADVLVNFAGRTIFKRWDDSYKQQIYDSRILTTRHLVETISPDKSVTLISTSAVGYYGDQKDDMLIETRPPGTDFLATLSRDWEAEALAAEKRGARVAIARFGIVLGNGGGALSKMLPLFRFFLGGPIGNGKHWVPWIHIRDVASGLLFLIENLSCRGPFNFSAPAPIRYREFSNAIGRVLGRPSFVKTPAFAVRLAMGEFGNVLLSSQRAVPHRLLEAGYKFHFTDIDSALKDLTQPSPNR
jgi:uncharacterized protein (TIGR01777 family)